ncbi:MAG: hypothetical protein A3D10_01675 [Omnitrophica WOR_2 bacterium RIFCSPHIGHO2_02_FULL_48_11]|nr:MAG: hypothetical protein A3D10_01675 [Omnitrophica WOR_2 bacterium RIFCSPHIGHO2_02_FULL_48_11]
MSHLWESRFFILIIMVAAMLASCASTPLRKPALDNRKEYVDAHRYLSQTIKEAIIKGKVVKGMTFDDVRATWGEPNEISTPEDNKFMSEGEVMWQYNRLFVVPVFVDFTNGIVRDVADDYK